MKEFDFLAELWSCDGETSDGEDNINIGNTELTFIEKHCQISTQMNSMKSMNTHLIIVRFR